MKFSEFPYYKPDIKLLSKNFNDLLTKFEGANSFDMQDKIFEKLYELKKDYQTMENIASVRFSLDSTNEDFVKDVDYFDFNSPVFLGLEKKYYELFNKSIFLKQFEEKYGRQLIKNSAREALIFCDELEDEYREESSLVNEFNKVRAGAVILFEGKENTLSGMRKHHGSSDREKRKKSMEASFSFYFSKRERVAEIFDRLVKIRTEIAKKLGYENYVGLAYTLLDKEFSTADIKKFRDNVVKYFTPLAERLGDKQMKRIGVDKMMYYDKPLKFKTGNPQPGGDAAWILEKGIEMYCDLSEETKEFITYMTENELVDLAGRKGKRNGGFSTFFHKFRAPYFFANMNGTAQDVMLLTHEAGHAFQSYLCRNYTLDVDMNVTVDLAEIHSMSMEFLTYDYMNIFFNEDTEKFYFKHLEDSVLWILDVSQNDEFQEIVYSNPTLINEERNTVWKELTQKYIPSSDNDGNKLLSGGLLWQNCGLILESPFYSIEYALAQVVAYQFLFLKKENHEEAMRKYIDFCKLGGKYTFSKSLKIAGLKNPFDEETVKEMAMKIETLLNSIDDSKF